MKSAVSSPKPASRSKKNSLAVMTLPASTSIEALMEATETVSFGQWGYGDWDDHFYEELAGCVPLVEKRTYESFILECENIVRGKDVQITIAYFGIVDYSGLFTIELRGTREDLDLIRRDIIRWLPNCICSCIPDNILDLNIDPQPVWPHECIVPCQYWLSREHDYPVWPPLIKTVTDA